MRRKKYQDIVKDFEAKLPRRMDAIDRLQGGYG